MAQSARDGSPDVWVVVDHQNGATRALRRGRLYCHPDAGLVVWDAVAVGVAAAVLQINQRLADAGQLGLRHRILIQVVLHPDTDFLARQTFETGEEPVHIRVREQVAQTSPRKRRPRRRPDRRRCSSSGQAAAQAGQAGQVAPLPRASHRTASHRQPCQCRPRQLLHVEQYGPRATWTSSFIESGEAVTMGGYRHQKLSRMCTDFLALRLTGPKKVGKCSSAAPPAKASHRPRLRQACDRRPGERSGAMRNRRRRRRLRRRHGPRRADRLRGGQAGWQTCRKTPALLRRLHQAAPTRATQNRPKRPPHILPSAARGLLIQRANTPVNGSSPTAVSQVWRGTKKVD